MAFPKEWRFDVSVTSAATQREKEVRSLIERWATAVRDHDRQGIVADHDPEMVMFDVPPPERLKGIKEYMDTWDLFFRWHKPGDAFDVRQMEVTAADTVAFSVVLMHCSGTNARGERNELDFRLTVGLKNVGGRWRIVHEHHSVPVSPAKLNTDT
jgi:ketosteroid isomerase-like protein